HVADEPTPGDSNHLRERLAQIAPPGAEVASCRVLAGNPAEAILKHAELLRAEAIAPGPHRRGRESVAPMCSTAAAVGRGPPRPCLVVPEDLRLPLERVTAAVDLSESSAGALVVALSWASALRPPRRRASLTVLHVARNADAKSRSAALQAEVERLRATGADAAHVDVDSRLVTGVDPAEAILAQTRSEPVDLLVLGTRRVITAASELGSVSAAVVEAATCPQLLVSPDAARDALRNSPPMGVGH